MSKALSTLRRKLKGARDLQSVVRTMKAMAAANVGPYERATVALADYCRTIELGLVTCLRSAPQLASLPETAPGRVGAIVFGTDQGMVAQFNERLVEFLVVTLPPSEPAPMVWVVGERMRGRVQDAGFEASAAFPTPNSVAAITPLVTELLVAIEGERENAGVREVHLFYNQPLRRAIYDPHTERLFPLDSRWQSGLRAIRWPSPALPEVILGAPDTLGALIREYLFVSIFRACAESLAAENASRFAAMQGAEKNINDLMATLTVSYHRQRQTAIDEELFDLIAGYEVLRVKKQSP